MLCQFFICGSFNVKSGFFEFFNDFIPDFAGCLIVSCFQEGLAVSVQNMLSCQFSRTSVVTLFWTIFAASSTDLSPLK